MSNDQLQLRGIISTLPESDQKELHAKAEEIRQVIRSSKFGLMACALVGIEIQDDPELATIDDDSEQEWRQVPIGKCATGNDLPQPGQVVEARYEGVYDRRIVTYWFDGRNRHFGLPNEPDGKGSQPATHWRPLKGGAK